MDERVTAYIENLVSEVLSEPNLASLTPDQKNEHSAKIRERLYDVILDTTIDNLNGEQLQAIKDIPVESEEFEKKLAEYSAAIPYMFVRFEESLKKEVENLKNNPLPTEPII